MSAKTGIEAGRECSLAMQSGELSECILKVGGEYGSFAYKFKQRDKQARTRKVEARMRAAKPRDQEVVVFDFIGAGTL